jgi:sterol desaturase/sphingolipid hydroxylase (fatty acid hydroxylase superfamily)
VVNLIALAIPAFFLGIFLEAWAGRARGLRVYRLPTALADMGCGIAQQLAGLFTTLALGAGFAWLYDHRLFTLPDGLAWIVAVVVLDFVYYWWHRLSHEVNFLWAAHGVHHQSEDYNLAVALRQSVFTSPTFFPFLAVLALLGVPLLQIGTIAALNNLYQFWIHTELIGTLGPLEKVVNTPSLHRVHHAINPKYLDRNHGGTFMVWDQLFGTYQKEEEPCVYGVTKPLGSYNPVWAQVEGYAGLVRRARAAPNAWEAVKVFVKSPAWHPDWFPDPKLPAVCARADQKKYDPQPPRAQRVWALVQFSALVLATFSLLMWGAALSQPLKLGAVALVYLVLINVAGLLEGRRWAVPGVRG